MRFSLPGSVRAAIRRGRDSPSSALLTLLYEGRPSGQFVAAIRPAENRQRTETTPCVMPTVLLCFLAVRPGPRDSGPTSPPRREPVDFRLVKWAEVDRLLPQGGRRLRPRGRPRAGQDHRGTALPRRLRLQPRDDPRPRPSPAPSSGTRSPAPRPTTTRPPEEQGRGPRHLLDPFERDRLDLHGHEAPARAGLGRGRGDEGGAGQARSSSSSPRPTPTAWTSWPTGTTGRKGKPWEGDGLPRLYHKYAGHDTNRDWFMLNLQETRLLTRLLYEECSRPRSPTTCTRWAPAAPACSSRRSSTRSTRTWTPGSTRGSP